LYCAEEQQRALCSRLAQDLEGVLQGGTGTTGRADILLFPFFRDISGLQTALQMRIQGVRSGLGAKPTDRNVNKLTVMGVGLTDDVFTPRDGRFKCAHGAHSRCIQSILELSSDPSDGEIEENARCSVCKSDWNRTGPKCRHCKIGEELEDLDPDRVTLQVLNALLSAVRGPFGTALLRSSKMNDIKDMLDNIQLRAKIFFDVIEMSNKELRAAWKMWRTHLDLLNDMDELNACKTAMRLLYEGEALTELSSEERNAVVVPVDVVARYHHHAAKQAMALGTLSRSKGTLQYLKNQRVDENTRERCGVCLDNFDDRCVNRSVLRCGHSFHSRCVDQLQARSGGMHSYITCPYKCSTRTNPKDILIASSQRQDDGSRNTRTIKGSYGTKVTRLVSDVLSECKEKGQKGLIFSQWDDMLDICEEALAENGVKCVRVKSPRYMGEHTERLRNDSECSVMLMNVKNGAEGLTLLEATHVFMIEPLLNCCLDSQGELLAFEFAVPVATFTSDPC
jgi:RING-like zinc finger